MRHVAFFISQIYALQAITQIKQRYCSFQRILFGQSISNTTKTNKYWL